MTFIVKISIKNQHKLYLKTTLPSNIITKAHE